MTFYDLKAAVKTLENDPRVTDNMEIAAYLEDPDETEPLASVAVTDTPRQIILSTFDHPNTVAR